ncbi:MAG: hypothetical protein B6D61_10540 [Bacteroidetes bacterium 4484_249]|nr:MAG: hypothetical protein B6D61_10540 [Bacteroidetes bacterium 4484_249]
METITLHKATNNLPEIIAMTLKNQEETVIATDDGAVVMIDQKNWEEILETLKLLRDKKSLNALLEGQSNRKHNKVTGKSIHQLFGDV